MRNNCSGIVDAKLFYVPTRKAAYAPLKLLSIQIFSFAGKILTQYVLDRRRINRPGEQQYLLAVFR